MKLIQAEDAAAGLPRHHTYLRASSESTLLKRVVSALPIGKRIYVQQWPGVISRTYIAAALFARQRRAAPRYSRSEGKINGCRSHGKSLKRSPPPAGREGTLNIA